MVFNSLEFAIFFLVFFFLYWLVFNRNLKEQNLLLLTGSYVFYAWWDWRFLSILIGSSLINYILGIYIGKTENEKHQRLLISLGVLQGLGLLLFFKYFNFFIESFIDAFSIFNITLSIHTLNLILPLGISFYTFRSISYLLDIESGKIKPTRDWVIYFTYISFFPCLLAGPIDKARDFIPQLGKKRIFDHNQAIDGLRQILWGLFKKIVIADNCTVITNHIFDNYQTLPASSLLIGAFFYSIQVYADFSGYSDMAIGVSRLIGLNVTKNFNFPFFAQNIAEFWQRWHISLTTWMTEYVYTPVSFIFRRWGKAGLIVAIIINFILIGIWHGANWTFIVFGFLHGCYFIPLIIRGTFNKPKSLGKNKMFPTFREFINMLLTFSLVALTTVVFRANTISQAFQYYARLFSFSFLKESPHAPEVFPKTVFLLVVFFMFIEWLGRENQFAIANPGFKSHRILRRCFYYLLILLIFSYAGREQQFIYFQF